MSSIYHGQLTVSIFGQSHAPAIGVTVDGLPAGEPVDLEELQVFLNRRAPGTGNWSTPRKEGDQPEFLSGLSQGRTCGAPLTAVIRNTNTRSGDYADLRDIPRPGHADYTAQVKYGGFQDVAGGGHFSGRLTAPLCIAGGICKQMLARRGIWVGAHIAAIGGIWDRAYDPVALSREDLLAPGRTRFSVLAPEAGERMQAAIATAKADRDSLGGIIECGVVGQRPILHGRGTGKTPNPPRGGDSGRYHQRYASGIPGGGKADPFHRTAPGQRQSVPGRKYHLRDTRTP